MIAILRYIIMKGVREGFIATFLFAPAAMFVTPLLVLGLLHAVRGHDAWPLTLALNMSPAESARTLTYPALFMSATISTMAAFWVFRTEMAGRTIAFFFLAKPPLVPPLATALFGAVMGFASCVLVVVMLSIVTQSPIAASMPSVRDSVFLAALGAAAGTFWVGLSSELNMLFPAFVITFIGVGLVINKPAIYDIAVLVAAVLLILAAPLTWRRRCAA